VTEVLVPAAIVMGLIVANGLFVAAEFAIVGAPRAAIEHRAAQGHRGARRVQAILDNPQLQDRFIATAQIGITIASLALGMYGEHKLAGWLERIFEGHFANPWIAAHALASVVAIGSLTYLHIVVGEMVPKALALQHSATTVLWIAPPVLVVQRAVYPLVVGLNAVGNGLLGLFGIRRQDVSAERYHTSEELQYIIQESEEGGLLRGESGQLLRELFEFGDMTAREVMVPRVHLSGIPVGASAEEVRTIVKRNLHTRYPVFDGDMDHIQGSIHIKRVLRHLVTGQPVAPSDARPLPYVPSTLPLDEVIGVLRRSRAQMAVVMDEHGGTAGVVTFEDLFEEVVGEIEEGRGPLPLSRTETGDLLVRGTVRIDEVGSALGLELDHPDVVTVSGLVLALLRRPAVPGDVVTWNQARVEVTAVWGRGVSEAVVSKSAASS
jgi:CBS domain containing-hemolysin-like protein